jgi:hypothetical protein
MYFCSMTFVFPYKKRTSDFELIQSIRWIRMSFPLAKIFTIGDEIDGVQNIPCPVFSNIRGVDVTNKILTFANQIGGKFIYMNDDFFVTPKLRAELPRAPQPEQHREPAQRLRLRLGIRYLPDYTFDLGEHACVPPRRVLALRVQRPRRVEHVPETRVELPVRDVGARSAEQARAVEGPNGL